MIMQCVRRLAFACLPVLAVWVAPAQATVIPFTVQFGSDGTGSFVYDDDNGGANSGFTTFALDFSPALGATYANIMLSTDGVALFGPGNNDTFAPTLLEILTDPSSIKSISINSLIFDTVFEISIHGGSASNLGFFGGFGCFIPQALAPQPGGYAFCGIEPAGSQIDGGGIFITSVPEPGTTLLLATGLLGFAWSRRYGVRSRVRRP
jgi:hypothetical protein